MQLRTACHPGQERLTTKSLSVGTCYHIGAHSPGGAFPAGCDNGGMEPTPTDAKTDAQEEYARRLAALGLSEAGLQRRSRSLGFLKLLAIALTVIAAAILAKEYPAYIFFLFAPLAVIVLLFVVHERVLRKLRRCARLSAFYRRGMARLEDRWAGTGDPGERFLDAAHPYARDLDLFGKGGLFELLSTARTRAGEEMLAAWLLAPAQAEEILPRQSAVEELQPRLDFRERLALAGEDLQVGLKPEELIAWSERSDRLDPRLARVAAPVLAVLWCLSFVAWAALGWGWAPVVLTVLTLAATYATRARVERAADGIGAALHDLDLLAAVFRSIEEQPFSSAKLVALQAALTSQGEPASAAVSRLQRRMEWFDSRENLFVRFADLFIFWTAQSAAAIEAWRAEYGAAVPGWIAAVGEMEALNALAGYAYEHPEDTFPEFVEGGPYLEAVGFAHPLLPRARAVANDLKLDSNLQLVVISGPNMAGKSTFIRSVGVNVVLAQAGAPVCASRMVLSRLNVAASICVLDSLQGGLSRFYAEILRLKLIDDQSRQQSHGAAPVLFLLDELLSGTNSHDRRVGTESFVRTLLARGAIGLITTHDLALAEIASDMGAHAANFHFEDTFENGELRFNYRLTPGVVSTANALKLMRSVGLDV